MSKIIVLFLSLTWALSWSGQFESIYSATSTGSQPPSSAPPTGFDPSDAQNAILGSSQINGYSDLLIVGDDWSNNVLVVRTDSLASTVATIAVTSNASYVPIEGETAITYERVGGLVVLRPLNGSRQSALVAMASTHRLFLYRISLNGTTFTSTLIRASKLPDNCIQSVGSYGLSGTAKRLALLSSSIDVDTLYHLAIGNPTFQHGTKNKSGRVDFITLNGTTGSYLQPNSVGITSGVPSSMYALEANAQFGAGIASVGDLNQDGVNDLAVLSPPNSIYIFYMENGNTPTNMIPRQITGSWLGDSYKLGLTNYTPICTGMEAVDLNGNGRKELVLRCLVNVHASSYRKIALLALGLTAQSSVESQQIIGIGAGSGPSHGQDGRSSPLILWDSDLGVPRIVIGSYQSSSGGIAARFDRFQLFNTDLNKNYGVLANNIRDSLVNLDSLFYRSGVDGYSIQTLHGLVDCELNANRGLACKIPATAAETWSAVEIASSGSCGQYNACKTKDTLWIYAAKIVKSDPVIRLPQAILLPKNSEKVVGSLRPLAFLSNYSQYPNTSVKLLTPASPWQAVQAHVSLFNELTLTALANKTGVDTLTIEMYKNSPFTQKIQVHVVDSAKIRTGVVPLTPGVDTIYSVSMGQYIELPRFNSTGVKYDYNIPQNMTNNDVQVVDHFLRVNRAENYKVTIRYIEQNQIKSRDLYLNPADPEIPVPIMDASINNLLSIVHRSSGLHIQGLQGDFELSVYNLNGSEIQSHHGYAQGSTWIPLKQSGVQIVKVRSGREIQIKRIVK